MTDMFMRPRSEKSWFIEWVEEYSQFFQGCGWFTYHPVYIEFENNKIMGSYEVAFIVLGLGFRWHWSHTVTPQMQECIDAVEGINAGTVKLVPWVGGKTDPDDGSDVVH